MNQRVINDPAAGGWELDPSTGYWMWRAAGGGYDDTELRGLISDNSDRITALEGATVDLTGYATETWVSTNYQVKGSYLVSSDLNGYATQTWVNSQGFAKGSFVPTSGNTTIAGTLTAKDFVATG